MTTVVIYVRVGWTTYLYTNYFYVSSWKSLIVTYDDRYSFMQTLLKNWVAAKIWIHSSLKGQRCMFIAATQFLNKVCFFVFVYHFFSYYIFLFLLHFLILIFRSCFNLYIWHLNFYTAIYCQSYKTIMTNFNMKFNRIEPKLQ